MSGLFLGGAWLAPILAGLLVALGVRRRVVARRIGITMTALVAAVAFVVFVSSEAELLTTAPVRGLAIAGLAVDGLSAVLLPVVACLALGVVVAMPRAEADPSAVASVLVVEGATLGVIVSANMLLLGIFWALALVPMVLEARRSGDGALRRASLWAFALSVVPMFVVIVGVVVLAVASRIPTPLDLHTIVESRVARPGARILAPILLVACCARMGVFPFHFWIPPALERGRLAIMLPTFVSPIGSYALIRVALGVFPVASRGWCGVLAVMATASALYGAVLALGQNNARRQLGYLWTSAAGFVLAGASTMDAEGLSGALVHDLALTIALTGLALLVNGVESRTGTSDLRRLGNLVVGAPRMATGYFLLGAASVGFPATVTFVSEDLVVQGLIRTEPVSAVLLLASTAVNGITLVRSFKRIFLGPASPFRLVRATVPDLLRRERWVSIALVLALIAGGFVPTPLLAIRRQVETEVLRRPARELRHDGMNAPPSEPSASTASSASSGRAR